MVLAFGPDAESPLSDAAGGEAAVIPDPELIPQIGQTGLEYGVEIVEEGPEIIQKTAGGIEETVHAVFYQKDRAEKVYDYFKSPTAR